MLLHYFPCSTSAVGTNELHIFISNLAQSPVENISFFGHIIVLTVSDKLPTLTKIIAVKTKTKPKILSSDLWWKKGVSESVPERWHRKF